VATLVLPELKLDHLLRLTDCTGIIQHAAYALPDRATGYTTDDNARALIAALRVGELAGHQAALRLAERYLSFLWHAQNPDGRFRNFMDYSRRFLEEVGSEDASGRALWACGVTVAAGHAHLEASARRMLERALPAVARLRAPRARAFALLGLAAWLEAEPGRTAVRALAVRLAEALVRQYRRTAGPGWHWFEDVLTYSNAVLPLALFRAYQATGRRSFLRVAAESLAFLSECHFRDGTLRLIGNRGWFRRGAARADFDEQPEDAGLLVLAHAAAYQATGREEHRRLAEDCFAWFLGRNALGCPLYEPRTGGCYDGLTPDGPNLNQGAESLLAYLLARLTVQELRARELERAAGAGRVDA